MTIHLPDELSRNRKHHQAIATSTTEAAEAMLAAKARLPPLRAIVLTGAPARGEGTAISVGSATWILSDVDLIAVFGSSREVLEARAVLVDLSREVTRRLRDRGLASHVDFAPHTEASLTGLSPSMFTMELARFAKVIDGDGTVLRGVRQIGPHEIPSVDALTLLTNRVVGQLILRRDLAGGDPLLRAFAAYHSGKVACDVLAAYLCYSGAYSPTYEGRIDASDALGASSLGLDSALLLQARRWTNFKLNPDATDDRQLVTGDALENDRQRLALWDDAARWLVSGWRALAGRYVGGTTEVEGLPAIVAAVSRREPFPSRIRDWIRLFRHPMLEGRRVRVPRVLAIGTGSSPTMAASLGALLLMAGDPESARRLAFLQPRSGDGGTDSGLQASLVEAWQLIMKGGAE